MEFSHFADATRCMLAEPDECQICFPRHCWHPSRLRIIIVFDFDTQRAHSPLNSAFIAVLLSRLLVAAHKWEAGPLPGHWAQWARKFQIDGWHI